MSVLLEATIYNLQSMILIQGGSITFRQVTSLPGANPAPNPPTYIAPVVEGFTALGSGTINFGVDLTQGGVFTGRLIAGDTFQVAGDPTTYTVSAQVISPSGNDTLTGVTFTPNLAQDEPSGAAITLAFIADFPGIPALITDYPSILINGTTIQEKDHRVRFLASALTGPDPIAGDIVFLPSGEVASVINVSHLEIQGVHYAWALHVRA